MKEWLFGVAGAAVIGVIALAVTPSGTVKKVLQLGVAMLLVVTVLHPLTGWGGVDAWDDKIGALLAEPQADIEKIGQELVSELIAEKTAAYIESKAQALGLVVSVEVECREGEYSPVPWAASIRSKTPEHALRALNDIIEADIGIPPERQQYIQIY